MDNQRIFIVEDVADYLETLVLLLKSEGLASEGSTSLNGALELLNLKLFHVALVDINLAGPRDTMNKDGLTVLERLIELSEGTKAIVLTGQRQPQLAADLALKYQIFDYIDKDTIQTDRQPLIDKVRDALQSTVIKRYGDADNVVSFLAEGDPSWVSNTLRDLSMRGGYDALKDFAEGFCSSLAPLLPPQESLTRMNLLSDRHMTFGRFWSKGLGAPIALVFCQSSRFQQLLDNPLPNWLKEPLYTESDASGVVGAAFELMDTQRSEFMETLPKKRRRGH